MLSCIAIVFRSRIQALINFRYLLYPTAPFDMFKVHQFAVGPVEVVRDVGYLLKQFYGGVA